MNLKHARREPPISAGRPAIQHAIASITASISKTFAAIASAVIAAFIIACILILPQRAGQHPGQSKTGQ